ncbi:MAG: 2-C-methyl-D-erythritol 4-phosphate cytidylyltransferase [Clostridia bacterium]|nr:2-C-methyl-D-erythritol 4-phosphate cytidylyltransferase [Clostridia bacterium]
MTETKHKLEYRIKNNKKAEFSAIIVSAGNSTRMGSVNKQMLTIGGIEVVARTLKAFEANENIKKIILVTRADDIFAMQMLAQKYNISKISDIVCGGNSRQESVLNGVARLDKTCNFVLIHDGARPLISQEIINSVCKKLETSVAVTCAVKVKDTIKQVDADGKVIKTVPREDLVAVQTPQGVRVHEYMRAVGKIGEISGFTDDTSIMEAAGHEVHIVEGSYKNIKITTPDDVIIAEGFLNEVEQ